MQVGVSMKVSLVGQTFALNPRCSDAPVKKTRNRCSREDRKTMVQSFINKYQSSNNGSFPSLNLTHREVGGSFYTIREIVREIIQENKVLAPGNPNSQVFRLEEYVESDSVPHSSLHLSIPVLDTYLSEDTVNKPNDVIVEDCQIDVVNLEENVITTTDPNKKSISSETRDSLEASQTSIQTSSDSLSQIYECVFDNVESTGGVVTYSTEIAMPLEEVDDEVSNIMEDISYSSRQSDNLRHSSEASMTVEGCSEEKTVDGVVVELDCFANKIDSERNIDLSNITDLGQSSVTYDGDTSENSEVSLGNMQAEKIQNIIHEAGPGGINSESKYKTQSNHLIDSSKTANSSSGDMQAEKIQNIIHETGPGGINSESKSKTQPNHLIDSSKTANSSSGDMQVSSGDMQAEKIRNIIHETVPEGIHSKYKIQPKQLIDSSEKANPSSDGVNNSESSKDAKKYKEESETNPIVDVIKGFFTGLVRFFTQK